MPEVEIPTRIDRLATRTIALLLFLIPLFHSAVLIDPFSLPKSVMLLAGAIVLAALGITSYLTEEEAARISSSVNVAIATLLGVAALSILTATNRLLALDGLLEMCAGVAIYWGVTRFVRAPAGAALLLRSVLAAAALVALAAIVQVIVPGSMLAPGGVSILPPSAAGTTFGDAGLTSQFLLLALPLGVGAAAMTSGPWRSVIGAGLGLIVAALLYAGGPESLLVGAMILLLLAATRAVRVAQRGEGWRALLPGAGSESLRAALLAVIAIIVVVAITRSPGLTRSGQPARPLRGVSLLAPTSGQPALDRAAALHGTWTLIGRHPLGVGPANWRHAFLEVAWTEVENSPFTLDHQAQRVGNTFVELTAETGVLGGVLFVALVLTLLVQSGLSGGREPAPRGTIGYTAFNTLGAFCFISFFGSPFQETAPALLFWVTAALAQISLLGATGLPARMGWLIPRRSPLFPRPVRHKKGAWAIVAVWVAFTVGAGLWMRERVAESHYTLIGRTAEHAGRDAQALQALELPPVRRSAHHVPHLLAGNAALRLGLIDKAIERYTLAIRRSPFFIGAFVGRAAAYQAGGRYDLAAADLDTALSIWPRGTRILIAMARLNVKRGRPEEALERYRDAIRIDRTLPEPFFAMGELLMQQGRIDEAIDALRACIGKDPRYPKLYVRLGEALEKKGMIEMAQRYYERGVATAPEDTEARLKMANSLHALGQFCAAQQALEGVLEMESDAGQRATLEDLIGKIEPRCRKQRRRLR